MSATRLPPPVGSYLKEETVAGSAAAITVGMAPPSTTDDGWWLAILWARDEEGVIEAHDICPRSGPPPEPPLLVLGPLFAGALSGLVAQENGRHALRLRLPPARNEGRPWERPLLLQLALKWDPVRSSTMTQNALAREALRAFAQAIESAGRPG